MTKGAKGAQPPTKSDMSSPAKAGGGTNLKYSPSSAQKKKDERNKPKIVNLIHPNGTCYGWAFYNFYAAKEELKSLSNRLDMITVIGVSNSSHSPILLQSGLRRQSYAI